MRREYDPIDRMRVVLEARPKDPFGLWLAHPDVHAADSLPLDHRVDR
jgi:hypothetical protein